MVFPGVALALRPLSGVTFASLAIFLENVAPGARTLETALGVLADEIARFG